MRPLGWAMHGWEFCLCRQCRKWPKAISRTGKRTENQRWKRDARKEVLERD